MNKNYISSTLQATIITEYNDIIERSNISKEVTDELQNQNVYQLEPIDEILSNNTDQIISIHKISENELNTVIDTYYTNLAISKEILDAHSVPERYEVKRLLRKIEKLNSK